MNNRGDWEQRKKRKIERKTPEEREAHREPYKFGGEYALLGARSKISIEV